MGTIYTPIKGFEGLYEISNEGEIISLFARKRKVMKQGIMTSGYKMIVLKKDKKQKVLSVHRLLALHFIPNHNNLEQVHHIDGNKLNNSLSNLEWVDRSTNIQHAYDSGLKKYRPLHYKGKFGKDHNRSKKVICVETGETFGSMSEASRKLKISISAVSLSVNEGMSVFGMHFQVGI